MSQHCCLRRLLCQVDPIILSVDEATEVSIEQVARGIVAAAQFTGRILESSRGSKKISSKAEEECS